MAGPPTGSCGKFRLQSNCLTWAVPKADASPGAHRTTPQNRISGDCLLLAASLFWLLRTTESRSFSVLSGLEVWGMLLVKDFEFLTSIDRNGKPLYLHTCLALSSPIVPLFSTTPFGLFSILELFRLPVAPCTAVRGQHWAGLLSLVLCLLTFRTTGSYANISPTLVFLLGPGVILQVLGSHTHRKACPGFPSLVPNKDPLLCGALFPCRNESNRPESFSAPQSTMWEPCHISLLLGGFCVTKILGHYTVTASHRCAVVSPE